MSTRQLSCGYLRTAELKVERYKRKGGAIVTDQLSAERASFLAVRSQYEIVFGAMNDATAPSSMRASNEFGEFAFSGMPLAARTLRAGDSLR